MIFISEIVEMLLRNGANINIRENEGWSPLYIACGNFGFLKSKT